MKTNHVILLTLLLLITLNVNAQINVTPSGNVGIGTNSTSNKLEINGSLRISGWTGILVDWSGFCCSTPTIYPESDWYLQLGKPSNRVGTIFVSGIHYGTLWGDSDEKLKENIDTLSNPMSKLMKVKGYHYNFKASTVNNFPETVKTISTKRQIGFIAQELEKEFPELVYKPDSAQSTYAVNYVGMIPVLLEAIKYQEQKFQKLQDIKNSQEQDIKELKNQIAELRRMIELKKR